jgi:hypothetical protein
MGQPDVSIIDITFNQPLIKLWVVLDFISS